MLEFRSNRIFKLLDADNSGSLSLNELQSYLEHAMGDDWNEEEFLKDCKTNFSHSFDNDSEVSQE